MNKDTVEVFEAIIKESKRQWQIIKKQGLEIEHLKEIINNHLDTQKKYVEVMEKYYGKK